MVRKSLAAKGERIVDFGSVSVRKDGRHLPVCVTGSPVISNDRSWELRKFGTSRIAS